MSSTDHKEQWRKFIWTRINKKDKHAKEISIPVWLKIDPSEGEMDPKKLAKTAKKIAKDVRDKVAEAESAAS